MTDSLQALLKRIRLYDKLHFSYDSWMKEYTIYSPQDREVIFKGSEHSLLLWLKGEKEN